MSHPLYLVIAGVNAGSVRSVYAASEAEDGETVVKMKSENLMLQTTLVNTIACFFRQIGQTNE